jgi:hypothetical protein
MTSTEAAVVIHHTPMSERQQLALIKRLEKANASSPRPANAQPGKNLFVSNFLHSNCRGATAAIAEACDPDLTLL